jgi:hypothetical protein
MRKSAIYLMFDFATGAIKIGYSVNPRTRARTLLSDRYSIKLLFHAYMISEEKAISAEWQLHVKYKDSRLQGEWFQLTKEEVDSIVADFQKYENKLDLAVYTLFASQLKAELPSYSISQLQELPAFTSFQKDCEVKMQEIDALRIELEKLSNKAAIDIKKSQKEITEAREAHKKYTVAITKTKYENERLAAYCEKLEEDKTILTNYINAYCEKLEEDKTIPTNYINAYPLPFIVYKWLNNLLLKVSRTGLLGFETRQL